jgi:photosystem II stability/assembly factor-like uncharacterized protein
MRTSFVLCAVLLLLAVPSTSSAQWASLNGPPGATATALASTDDVMIAGTHQGVYRSTDDGATWTFIGLRGWTIHDVLITSTSLIATAQGTVFRYDSDTTWLARRLNVPPAYQNLTLVSNGRVIIASEAAVESRESFFHRSTDDGRTWTAMNSFVPFVSRVYALAAVGTDLILGGPQMTIRSTNDGEDWTPLDMSSTPITNALATLGDTVLATDAWGLWLSTDHGASWRNCERCPDRSQKFTAVLGATGEDFLVATDSGIYAAPAGRGWDRLAWRRIDPEMKSAHVRDLTGRNGAIVVASTSAGIIRTTDAGTTWAGASDGIIGSTVTSLIHHRGSLFTGTSGGIYATPDYGSTWHFRGFVDSVYALASIGDALFAARGRRGLHRSSDAGATWTNVSDAFPTVLHADSIGVLALHASGTRLLAGTDYGLYRSDDLGASWTPVDTGFRWRSEPIRAFTEAGGRVFMASSGVGTGRIPFGGVYVSIDAGASWQRTALAYTFPSVALASGGDIIVSALDGTAPSGSRVQLMRSTDAGATWSELAVRPNMYSPVFDVAVRDGAILAGTSTGPWLRRVRESSFDALDYKLPESRVTTVVAFDAAGALAGLERLGLWRYQVVASAPPTVDVSSPLAVLVVHNQLLIDGDGGTGLTARIVDALGRVHSTHTLDALPASLPLTTLVAGAYFLTIDNGATRQTIPFAYLPR